MTERLGAAFFGFVATVLVNALGIFLFVKVVDWSTSTDFSLSWRDSGLLALIYITLRFWNPPCSTPRVGADPPGVVDGTTPDGRPCHRAKGGQLGAVVIC